MTKTASKILIADDDPEDIEMLEQALNEANPDVVIDTAIGGSQAITLLLQNTTAELPNLIVLDYNMPDVSGAQVLSHLKQLERFLSIPCVIFSTSNSERHVADCLQKGAAAYFVKPSSKKELDAIALKMLSLAGL